MDQPIRPIFDPRFMPPRREDGFVFHPDLDERWHHPVIGEEYMDTLKLAEAGFAWTYRDMEDEVSDEELERYTEECDCSGWTPPDLSAEGGQLIAIYDTEDGARALYVKPVTGAEQEALIARERADMEELLKRQARRSL